MKKQYRMLALFLSVLLMLSALAGCGAKSATSDTAAGETASSTGSAAMEENGMAMDMGTTEAAPEAPAKNSDTGDSGGSTPAQLDLSEQKIIYSADVTVETLEFDKALDALDQMISELGGFAESANVSGNSRYDSDGTVQITDRAAYYTIRVPADRFREALDRTGSIGNVISATEDAQNVTSQFIDQEARQNSLEVQEERLLELLSQAADVDTLVTLEARLSEVRYEIESIERTLRNMQNQVDYSTITLSLYEVAVYTPTASVQRTFGQRVSDALSGGWTNFSRTMEDLFIGILYSLPALLLLAVIVIVAVVVLRRVRRKRHGNHLPPVDKTDNDQSSQN
mgnify:CR=1 FL=1